MLTFPVCQHGRVLSLIVSQTYIALILSSSLHSRFQLLRFLGKLERVLFVCDSGLLVFSAPSRTLVRPHRMKLEAHFTFGRVLETTVNHSAQKLRLQHEILEVGSVNTDIVAPRIQ